MSDILLEAFWDTAAWGHQGSNIETCGHCGRVFFASEACFDFEDGELEILQKMEKKDPDKFRDLGECAVIHARVFDKEYVEACPCGAAKQLAEALWSERYGITRFIPGVAERLLKNAEREMKVAARLVPA